MEKGGKRMGVRVTQCEKTQLVLAGFEDGMGPQTKECGLPPGARKNKEMELPPETPEGTQLN